MRRSVAVAALALLGVAALLLRAARAQSAVEQAAVFFRYDTATTAWTRGYAESSGEVQLVGSAQDIAYDAASNEFAVGGALFVQNAADYDVNLMRVSGAPPYAIAVGSSFPLGRMSYAVNRALHDGMRGLYVCGDFAYPATDDGSSAALASVAYNPTYFGSDAGQSRANWLPLLDPTTGRYGLNAPCRSIALYGTRWVFFSLARPDTGASVWQWDAEGHVWTPLAGLTQNVLVLRLNESTLWAVEYADTGVSQMYTREVSNTSGATTTAMGRYLGGWNTKLESIVGPINALAFHHSGSLFVGGDLESVTNTNVTGSAVFFWHPVTGWDNLNGGLSFGIIRDAIVHDIICNDTVVYFSGWFYNAASDSTNMLYSVARYLPDVELADRWHSLGRGIYGMAKTMYMVGSYVYVGTWLNSVPATDGTIYFVLYGLGGLALLLQAGLVLYLVGIFVKRRRGLLPKNSCHLRFRSLFSSSIFLLSALAARSITLRVAVVEQIALIRGLGLAEAYAVSAYGEMAQSIACMVIAPLFGFLTTRYSTRMLALIALSFGIIGQIFFIILVNETIVYTSYVFCGCCYGAFFVVVLSYYARTSSVNTIVVPLLALFFCTDSLPTLLSQVIALLFQVGLLQPDFVSADMLQLATLAFIIVMLLLGFEEQRLNPQERIPLRQQFSVTNRGAVAFACLAYLYCRFSAGLFESVSINYFRDVLPSIAFSTGGFLVAILLWLVFYYVIARKGLRTAFVVSLVIVFVGYGVIVITLLAFGQSVTATNAAGLSSLLAGSMTVSAATNVLFVACAALFVTILPQYSRGTMIGIFSSVGLIAPYLGSALATPILFRYSFSTSSSGVILLVSSGVLLVIAITFGRLYQRLAPRMLLPFTISTTRLGMQKSRKSGTPAKVDLRTPLVDHSVQPLSVVLRQRAETLAMTPESSPAGTYAAPMLTSHAVNTTAPLRVDDVLPRMSTDSAQAGLDSDVSSNASAAHASTSAFMSLGGTRYQSRRATSADDSRWDDID